MHASVRLPSCLLPAVFLHRWIRYVCFLVKSSDPANFPLPKFFSLCNDKTKRASCTRLNVVSRHATCEGVSYSPKQI